MYNPLPKWFDCKLPEEFDIAVLRFPNLSKSERFETEDDVYERVDYIVPNLNGRLPRIALRVENCAKGLKTNGVKNCLLPICPNCGRQYRRTLIGDFFKIYNLNPDGAQTATAYLGEYEAGTLKSASLGTAHDRFRKKLERCDFGGAIVIGGTEATYRNELNDWLLHLHLLSLGASSQAWENLEKCMSKYGIHDPLRIEPVNDPIKQLSYLQKFCTYHRPGKHRETTARRLSPSRRISSANWHPGHVTTNFLISPFALEPRSAMDAFGQVTKRKRPSLAGAAINKMYHAPTLPTCLRGYGTPFQSCGKPLGYVRRHQSNLIQRSY